MVKEVQGKHIIAAVKQPNGTSVVEKIPYGLLVWATGNAPRPLVKDLIEKIPAQKGSRRGLVVNDFLVVEGTEGIWFVSFNGVNNRSLGDCAATKFAPTAQVAAQQGTYLARLFNTMARTETLESEIATLGKQQFSSSEVETKQKQLSKVKLMKPFEYSHQGYPFASCADARIIGVYRQ
jgi:NADH:ubiquinone reductase (non-electrogenic)